MAATRCVSFGLLVMATISGCADAGNDAQNASDTVATADTASSIANQTNQPAKDGNHDFLDMMSDHHAGLILIATAAADKAASSTTRNDAQKLHTKQAAERDSMVAMIQRDYQEQHRPQSSAKNQAQADSLNALSGAEYDRKFYGLIIDHHREGISMIDQHLPHLTKPQVRQMAEKMKGDQQKEITEFQRKMKAL